MVTATLMKGSIQWGWLTGSEAQSVIVIVELSQSASRHGDGEMRELRIVHLDPQAGEVTVPH